MTPGTLFALGAAFMLSVVLFVHKVAGLMPELPLLVIIAPLLIVALIHGGLVVIDAVVHRLFARFLPKPPPVHRPRKSSIALHPKP